MKKEVINNSKKIEKGQAIVVILLAMMGLLGFTALAVDGAMLFSDRRYDQNVSDTSALSGGLSIAETWESDGVTYMNSDFCDNSTNAITQGEAAAIALANENNLTIAGADLDNAIHGVEAVCSDIQHTGWAERYVDVEVMVTNEINTSFVHLFSNEASQNTTKAIVRVKPKEPLALGHALVALDPVCSVNYDNLSFDGNVAVTITGSGAYSNSCIYGQGSVDVQAVDAEFEEIVYVDSAKIFESGFNPIPVKGTKIIEIPYDQIPIPDCSGPNQGSEIVNNGQTLDLSPGVYEKLTNNGGTLNLSPGLYCFNGAVSLTGGVTNSTAITFYLVDDKFTSTGNAEVHLNAAIEGQPDYDLGIANGAIEGLVVYSAHDNTSVIKLAGNELSAFTGTVLGTSASIEVLGNSDNQ
ncbi:MAG: Tad domain-containing protein, partial [Anaerolineaceae bacterium]|nr:Tad domain-containing protein [Anaerolineaceae bacterium]